MRSDKPIMQSLLDQDFYKFTMGQMIHDLHPNVPTIFSFLNRSTSVQLAKLIDVGQLREELEHCRTLRFTSQELHYLMGVYEYDRPMFSVDYIRFLEKMRLPEFDLSVTEDWQFDIKFNGSWGTNTYWENPGMYIVSELYTRSLMQNYSRFEREMVEARGRIKLDNKIREWRQYDDITYSDFGTRRRASRDNQDYVVGVLAEECKKQFKGTSNVLFAQKYGVTPIGTNAHELPMVYSGIYHERDEKDPTFSQKKVLEDWEAKYGPGLLIFLPDTMSTRWFLEKVVTKDQLMRWSGSRQDSGVPAQYAEMWIDSYRKAGVDPKKKIIVAADGLQTGSVISIRNILKGKTQFSFGIGTFLTNDIGFPTVSIVVKPTWADGHFVCKLSDNVAKATGDSTAIDRWKNLISYDNKFSEACVS